jgi:hypothetical protein
MHLVLNALACVQPSAPPVPHATFGPLLFVRRLCRAPFPRPEDKSSLSSAHSVLSTHLIPLLANRIAIGRTPRQSCITGTADLGRRVSFLILLRASHTRETRSPAILTPFAAHLR